MSDDLSFTCSVCGKTHEGLPNLGFDYPIYYHQLNETERRELARLTSDTCVINDDDFFIRGCLEIPIHGRSDPFTYGVWVTLSRDNFARYEEFYEDRNRKIEGDSPYFGWFSNQIPGYAETLNLKTHVHLRPYPLRPRIELEPTDHQLSIDQRNGFTVERLRSLLEANEHAK